MATLLILACITRTNHSCSITYIITFIRNYLLSLKSSVNGLQIIKVCQSQPIFHKEQHLHNEANIDQLIGYFIT